MGDASVFTRRLKEARRRKGLSQEQLGILAGVDEFSASARMNQYERGKHVPDQTMVARIAAALEVPVPYLFAADDQMANLLLIFDRLPPADRVALVDYADQLLKG